MENITAEQAGQMNFTLPHDVVTLPSGGVFYKTKKKVVKIGYLTAADENTLANVVTTGNIKEGIILNLVRSKLYETDIRPEELLEGDIEAIMLFLRNTSFGPEYNVTINDPDTDKPFPTTIVLDELNIKKPTVLPDNDGTFTTTLPKTGATVKLKPLSFGETLELEKMADSYPQGRIPPRVTWKLMKHIVELNGNSDRNQISMFVDTMPIMDSKYIRKFLSENEPRLDLTKTILTPSGNKVDVAIAFGVEFFRPFF
jgi:hypothetical protein